MKGFMLALFMFLVPAIAYSADDVVVAAAATQAYTVGVDDVLEIAVLQPEKIDQLVTVAPDGSINFPYIGNVPALGLSLGTLQENIQESLAKGYLKYPVVAVTLKESRSRKYFVYGEVNRPGAYPLDANATVLRGISNAGGFTKFGSSSHVKVMRPNKNKPGYKLYKINMDQVMNGVASADMLIEPGDIIVVSEGVF